MNFKRITYIILFSCLIFACGRGSGVQLPADKKGFKLLSEYQLFRGTMAELQPNDGVIPYDLNTPLFSDYALKARFIRVPEGETAKVKDDGTLDFPEKTILVKNFYYETEGKKNIIETRLLIKSGSTWNAYTYVWNKEQTEAQLEVAGASIPTTFIHNGEKISFNYSVPNKNQCKSCHNVDNNLVPIGPKLSNLNKAFEYINGSKNQLEYWKAKGILTYTADEKTPAFPAWDNPVYSLEQRAKAYLDVNCGHCHSPKGPANTSGLFLQFNNSNDIHWGICKTPVAAGRGSGGKSFDIHPGNPDGSILLYRMNSDDPGIMMPEIGRKLIHKEAVELISKWIKEMEATDCK